MYFCDTNTIFIFVFQMELEVRIKMNDKLFLKNPEDSVLGRKILKNGLALISKIGFEDFNFKKLATDIDTTEASIYRYFENKHKLLTYYISWYWSYMEYQLVFTLNNVKDPEFKLKTVIQLLINKPINQDDNHNLISESDAYKLLMWEGSKTYMTRHVTKDNKERLFKPYKDICARIAAIIKECNAKYKYPHTLASTLLEMSHTQKFFMQNLPALTDSNVKEDAQLITFLEHLVFNAIKA
jgi:AcrR family transcriptional regulator